MVMRGSIVNASSGRLFQVVIVAANAKKSRPRGSGNGPVLGDEKPSFALRQIQNVADLATLKVYAIEPLSQFLRQPYSNHDGTNSNVYAWVG